MNTRGGGDSPFLLQRTMEMAENLSSAVFPVRWMGHAAYDLGFPFFHHYAALPYYLSGGLTALGLNPLTAIQAIQTLGFLLAAVGMGLWSRQLFQHSGSVLLAVCAYSFAPFHMVNVYVRGDSLSEFYAFAWYPLILYTIDRVRVSPSWGRIATAAAAYAALALTHNVSLLIFTPFALLYALLMAGTGHTCTPTDGPAPDRKHMVLTPYLRCLLPFALGLALSAWFWLPAIAETRLGQMGEAFTEGYFHYTQHFRTTNLVQTSPAFDYRVATQAQEAGPFAMGLAQAAVAVAGVLALILAASRRRQAGARAKGRSASFLVGGFLIASAMITPLSAALWQHLPLLSMTQFPWRFLSVQALFTAALSAGLVESVATLVSAAIRDRWRWLLPGVALILSLALGAASLADLSPERLMITEEDANRENLLLYEAFTGNIGTTIRYEYLPRDVVPRLYISEAAVTGEVAALTTGDHGLQARLVARSPIRQVWEVRLREATEVSFPVNWWPGWRAEVDGVRGEAHPYEGSGRLALDLTGGEHTVELVLGHTPLRMAAILVSVITLVGLGVWGVLRHAHCEHSGAWLAVLAMGGVAILAPLVAMAASPQRSTAATFFDFDQMPYVHQGPVRFGNARLESVSLGTPVAAAGESLTVRMEWDLAESAPLSATVRLASPAEPRHGVSYTLSSAEVHIEDNTHLSLQLPEDLSRGLYLVGIEVYSDGRRLQPRTASGHGMGSMYIGAVRVPHGPALPALAEPVATFSEITLLRATAAQLSPTTLRLKLQWSTPGTARNWSLSLRLLDSNGRQVVQKDLQPGYGYLPTTLWEPGTLITDYPVLTLPEGLAPGPYTLRIIAYLEATMAVGGQADIPIDLSQPVLWDMRDACCEQTRKGKTILCTLEGIALIGTDIPATLDEGHDLTFSTEWNVTQSPAGDVRTRWAVVTAAGTPIAVSEGPLAAGLPTSVWPLHTWVQAPVAIDLPALLDESEYRISLVISSAKGAEIVCTLPHQLQVTPRPRAFEAPPLPHPEISTFGAEIQLLGYALEQSRGSLELTLWWQAQEAPAKDLKRFVHLFDPRTETIVAQDDAMPKAWTYPTSWWQAGEVVSETITLSLAQIPQGSYELAVGWYEPETITRLPVHDAAGVLMPNERWVLQTTVRVR